MPPTADLHDLPEKGDIPAQVTGRRQHRIGSPQSAEKNRYFRLPTRPLARLADAATATNLTLLTPPGNSSAGNLGFEAKKTRLKDSLLKTNIAIAAEPQWDEEAMARRADGIIQAAAKLWPAPSDSAPAVAG